MPAALAETDVVVTATPGVFVSEGEAAQAAADLVAEGYVLEGVLFFVLLGVSALFSCSETAMTAASRARMHTLESDGSKRAALVNRLRESKDRMISSLLLGNNLVNIFASALATAVLIRIFGPAGVAYATIVVTILVVVFAEVMPKMLALLHSDRVALAVAPFVSAVTTVFSPITSAINRIVHAAFRAFGVRADDVGNIYEEELRGVIELMGAEKTSPENGSTAQSGQDPTQETKAMLRSILDLADVQVAEIMIHRRDVRTVDVALPMVKIVDTVLNSTFTRLPVWQDTPDNIIGIVHTKLLLQEIRNCGGDVSRINIRKAMMEPWFIPDSTVLFDQLQAFRKRREHFAVVVDEYGTLQGVVTLEDILEEIVGQIDDESDTGVSGVRPQADGSYIIEGKVTIRDLNREFGWGLPDEDYATLAGLLLFESRQVPMLGQSYTFFDFRFEILKKHRNQITLVGVHPPSS